MKPKQLKKILDSGKEVVLIDVREPGEYKKGVKVEGAKNIPMGQMFIDSGTGKLPKNKKIVTICKTGGRCDIVARELKKKGYDIESLEGGTTAWKST